MLKRFLCGAAILSLLCGSVSTPTEAEELYVRNRLFKDAYFLGNKTYIPVDTFLRAIDMEWSVSNGMLVIGSGDSPEWAPQGETFRATRDGQDLVLTGIVRGDRIYVPAKELAEFVDYKVLYNADTGIVDVVQGRLTSSMDQKAAKEVASAKQAEKEARDAAWQKRVAAAKAAREAKVNEVESEVSESAGIMNEDLEAKGNPDKDPSDTKTQKIDGKDDRANASYENERKPGEAPGIMNEDLEAKGNPDKDPSDTKTQKIDGKDDDADASYESEKPSSDVDPSDDNSEPAEADLVVLSTNADPNNYTGEVKFRAVLQNQGYAQATDVKARFVVTGPDGKEWVSKTLYHGPMEPDASWEITEDYKHRLGAAIPRGNYNVSVTPTFKSAGQKK
jgi:hypothetical protein